MFDKKELQKITTDAIRRGQKRADAVAAEKVRLEKQQRQEDESCAAAVFSRIPVEAETAAAAGKSSAVVMELSYKDYDKPADCKDFNRFDPSWLKGAAKIVYEQCFQSGLNVRIDYWHTGDGMDSGFNIVLTWGF